MTSAANEVLLNKPRNKHVLQKPDLGQVAVVLCLTYHVDDHPSHTTSRQQRCSNASSSCSQLHAPSAGSKV